jgi:hypothetical protein
MDQLEETGTVGENNGSSSREVPVKDLSSLIDLIQNIKANTEIPECQPGDILSYMN